MKWWPKFTARPTGPPTEEEIQRTARDIERAFKQVANVVQDMIDEGLITTDGKLTDKGRAWQENEKTRKGRRANNKIRRTWRNASVS